MTERAYPPVDFSYKKLSACSEMARIEPRSGTRKKIQKVVEVKVSEVVHDSELAITRGKTRTMNNTTNKSPVTSPVKNSDAKKHDAEEDKYSGYLGGALKLSNNSLSKLDGLVETCKKFMETPENIRWIDLSFNNFTTLESIENLNLDLDVLYLHGNVIEDIKEVKRLSKFKNLRSLTLHGNPVDEIKNYRYHIIALIPSLKSLDFAAVTKKDLDTAMTFQNIFLKKTKKHTETEK